MKSSALRQTTEVVSRRIPSHAPSVEPPPCNLLGSADSSSWKAPSVYIATAEASAKTAFSCSSARAIGAAIRLVCLGTACNLFVSLIPQISNYYVMVKTLTLRHYHNVGSCWKIWEERDHLLQFCARKWPSLQIYCYALLILLASMAQAS